ncbi:hypothetical protein K458DRAFT_372635 [Lentithecium fluviatile CBS 122367]|uniref:Arrestin n=1 Tax=Lentithecium fluviatile CBS 122367 TaxID=1168545 RepID=A0A6G1IT32_9PLEO|nr:hypothetical protein K458DRAFT_372635 [Lentithecium fluviatile CBS 122367]
MPASSSRRASTTSNMQSLGYQMQHRMLQIAHYGQPTIEIALDESRHGTQGSYVTSYSTMDTIEGTVAITAPHDTRFEDIQIAFTGTSQVYVDRLTTTPSMSGRTEAQHRFLTLKQPVDDADLPLPRILMAGKKYTFPFYFTVPSQLLPRACSHTVASDYVRETHLMLPPSLGDAELSGFGGVLLDDMAPDMSKVIYAIKVRITQFHEGEGKMSIVAEKMRKVRVKPAFEEQPPLNVDGNPEYRLRQEKAIRKGLFKGKMGTLTATTVQPKALIIPGARTICNQAVATRARVHLRWDPVDDHTLPPKLGSLKTSIKVSTYYASAPRANFPTRDSLGYDLTQGVYGENVSISTMCVESAQWHKQPASANPIVSDGIDRRDSGISDCSTSTTDTHNSDIPPASKNYKHGSFYTASILVPITLPHNKNFIPTFHSCLVSRTYALSLTISAQAPGVSDPSLHLKVPLQICAEGSATGNENARARSAEVGVLDEVGMMFRPRSVAPPTGTSGSGADAPPEYVAFPPTVGRYGARVTAVG